MQKGLVYHVRKVRDRADALAGAFNDLLEVLQGTEAEDDFCDEYQSSTSSSKHKNSRHDKGREGEEVGGHDENGENDEDGNGRTFFQEIMRRLNPQPPTTTTTVHETTPFVHTTHPPPNPTSACASPAIVRDSCADQTSCSGKPTPGVMEPSCGRTVLPRTHAANDGSVGECKPRFYPLSTPICMRCGELTHISQQCLTFRVQMCRFPPGTCINGDSCSYAHTPDQRRSPWKVTCVRVIRSSSGFQVVGCGREHPFVSCSQKWLLNDT